MTFQSPLGLFAEVPGGFVAMLNEARECPACHQMHVLVVNRNGRTLCVSCANDSNRGVVNRNHARLITSNSEFDSRHRNQFDCLGPGSNVASAMADRTSLASASPYSHGERSEDLSVAATSQGTVIEARNPLVQPDCTPGSDARVAGGFQAGASLNANGPTFSSGTEPRRAALHSSDTGNKVNVESGDARITASAEMPTVPTQLESAYPVDLIYRAIQDGADWPTISRMINDLPAHISMSKRVTHQIWLLHNCSDCGIDGSCEDCGCCKEHCDCEGASEL